MTRCLRYGAYPAVILIVVLIGLAVARGLVDAWPTLALLAAGGILTVAWLERRLPFETAWRADHGDTQADVQHALVNWALLSMAAYIIALLHTAMGMPAVWPATWGVLGQLALIAVLFDFGLYAMHVLSHRWSTAWRFHAIHHSAERLYWLNGERRHPISAMLMAAPGVLVLALLGAPATLVSVWLTIVAVHLAFQHANVDYRLGPFRRWIAGAETHRWHHKREYEDAQVNFGEFFLVWDHLFGTFAEPKSTLGPRDVGLRQNTVPNRYLGQLVWPFRMPAPARVAFGMRLAQGRRALAAGRLEEAIAHFEAAHILGQSWTIPHVISHVALLRWGWAASQRSEVVGQLPRLVAAALVTWLWVPRGNPGSTRVSALASVTVPESLAAVLAGRDA